MIVGRVLTGGFVIHPIVIRIVQTDDRDIRAALVGGRTEGRGHRRFATTRHAADAHDLGWQLARLKATELLDRGVDAHALGALAARALPGGGARGKL